VSDPGQPGAGGQSGNVVVEAVRSGRAARPARLAAARGALPLTAGELLLLQILLARDEDAEIANAARASLASVDAPTAESLAADPDTDLLVLRFLASEPAHWPDAARLLAASTRLPGEDLHAIASSSLPEALSVLVANSQALSEDHSLGDVLAANPALAGADRMRLLDYLEELAKPARAPLTAASGAAAAGDAATGALAEGLAPAKDPFLAALGIDAEVELLLPELGIEIGALSERSELLGEAEDEDEATLIKRLSKLNIGQKLRVALLGERSERTILVRDSNRLIACAVVKNAKFTTHEAETVANSRNVNQEVLRLIARHRDFSASYTIQHSLVRNPRCPPEVALPFIPQLNDKDIRLLLKNRNISEMVRRQAKRTLETREARRRVRLGPSRH
jgi:hypothetical protein